jgi:hypothetical protein
MYLSGRSRLEIEELTKEIVKTINHQKIKLKLPSLFRGCAAGCIE